jgi:hypothetical protein
LEQDTTGVETSVGSLASIVAADGPLGFTEVLGMGADVADSLAERHATGEAHGAVHARAVVKGGDGPWVLAAPGLAAGTKPALAPELADGDAPTPEGDVFALGATLVFALTGQAFVDGALGASEPAGAASAESATPASAAPAGPLSLPDVMGLFLETLRRTLANDPAVRGSAAKLAGTLRQLRNDAERAMAPPVIVDDPSARRVVAAGGAGVAAAAGGAALAAPGVIAVEGTTTGVDPAKKNFKQRLPALLAVAAILVALVLGGLLLRKDDKPNTDLTATGPSTTTTAVLATSSVAPQTVIVVVTEAPTSSTATSTTKVTTTTAPPPTVPITAPPTVAPPVTAPPPPAGTIGMTVDMSQMISCGSCPAPVRKDPSRFSQVLFSAPDKTVLWAQCLRKAEAITVDGVTDDRWIYVVGPLSPGYVSIIFVGRAVPAGLPDCPPPVTTPTNPTTTKA